VQLAAKDGHGAESASGCPRSPDCRRGIGTILIGRRPGDIREYGCPAATRTDSFPTKPARKTTAGALANIKIRK
jgi:hypothetical protein